VLSTPHHATPPTLPPLTTPTDPHLPGIDDDDLISLLLKLLNPLLSNHHWVHLSVAAVERDTSLRGVLLQLIEGPRPESVGTNQTCLPILALVVGRQLKGRGRTRYGVYYWLSYMELRTTGFGTHRIYPSNG